MTATGKNYIAGEWRKTEEAFESRNPSNWDEVVGTFPRSGEKEVAEAVAAARRAFPEWRRWSRVRRGELFDRFVDLAKSRKEDLAREIARECGKAINESRADVVEGIHMAQYVFGSARMPHGHVISSEIAEKDAYVVRKPKGVMAAITPWNFPFAIPLWLLGPSLVEGNTVVFKPSEDTPLIGHRLAELFHEAGFPPGVVNVVHGTGEEAGAPLVRHPEVDAVLFTGSAEVGAEIRRVCAAHPHKLAVCEMGGKNALIVFEDANFELALSAGVLSAFKTSGQRCVSAGRILIHESLLDRYAEHFVPLAQRLRVGDPLDEATFMGPLINEAGVRKVQRYNGLAEEEGAEVLLKGGRLEGNGLARGWFMSPFVCVMRPDSKSRVLREEVFGPHVALVPFRETEEAVAIYNGTEYGLACAVVTEDFRKARHVLRECEFGLGYHNLPTIGAEVHLPFGGVKKSGTGMPSASALIDAVTHRVAWTVNHGSRIQMAQGLKAEI
ncbi:MAG: aldehyde dehydrogenase family protein [Candidatus Tectomicrobia bacterium]|nr:aldehyde dehydrogenase family protein [Candidatus Tectomicrobia bacterium]